MRIEIAGAQITDAVVDVIETLQSSPEITKTYINTIDELTRTVILDLSAADDEADAVTLSRVRVLQMIRRDIIALATPPDVDIPANDTPLASF